MTSLYRSDIFGLLIFNEAEYMENKRDIRWEQRFANYRRALAKLTSALELDPSKMTELEQEGLVQRFEYTHELAWNVMKDYFTYQGNNHITGSRDATREAFQNGLIENGEAWMEMIGSRNKTTLLYNQQTVEEITKSIIHDYYSLFLAFEKKMDALRSGSQSKILTKDL
jgi:nucleotidyltransferase substrate binding protein (TIGR01987 family)